jgi:hypothetical protein
MVFASILFIYLFTHVKNIRYDVRTQTALYGFSLANDWWEIFLFALLQITTLTMHNVFNVVFVIDCVFVPCLIQKGCVPCMLESCCSFVKELP